MRILVAVVHYWDPAGGGRHQSLSPDPIPRVEALQSLILSLARLGRRQSLLDIASRSVVQCNDSISHQIDICLITDGEHHVLDLLGKDFDGSYTLVCTEPKSPKHLGFEAHQFLASNLDADYDMYCFLEDDLVIHDPLFFRKISWFQDKHGIDSLLLPHRIELTSYPHPVDRFFIDGPLHPNELSQIMPNKNPTLIENFLGTQIHFESPQNPHAGCFFLTSEQLDFWTNHSSWADSDDSWISPLESAATLSISKAFKLYKPSYSCAGWLELQHYGLSFHCKINTSSIYS